MNLSSTERSALGPELARYYQQLQQIKEEVRALTGGLGHAAFNAQPEPGRWSVGQCLHHLNVAGYQLVPKLEAAVERGRRHGERAEGPFRYGFLTRLFIRVLDPDARLKLPAPGRFRPADDLAADLVVLEFAALQDRLAACVAGAGGLDLEGIKVPSPITDWVRLSLGAWFAATISHEQRHLAQARRALEAVRG